MQSLYVHIPFCEKKCFYCSFAVTVSKKNIDGYLASLAEEMACYQGLQFDTIYLGGGTPSLLAASQIKFLISKLRKNFRLTPGAEFTWEANPEHVGLPKVKLLMSLGVNRFSLGAQTFDDKKLMVLGRNHGREAIFRAHQCLRDGGVDNISMDLIYGIPGQTREDVKKDLNEITKLRCAHVSVYSLSVEEKSLFYARKVRAANKEEQASQFIMVRRALTQVGYQQYEISNFALNNCQSKHNLNYWMGGNYIGLGVGAHSHVDGRRFWNTHSTFAYIKNMREKKSAMAGEEFLSLEERLVETFLIGLRMKQGVYLQGLEERFHCRMDKRRLNIIQDLMQAGFLLKDNERIKTTLRGELVLDELCARLI